MGQFAAKQAVDTRKSRAVDAIADRCHKVLLAEIVKAKEAKKAKKPEEAKEEAKEAKERDEYLWSIFCHEICGAVKDMNDKLGGSMLLSLPEIDKVKKTYEIRVHDGKIEKEHFRDLIKELLSPESFGVKGFLQTVGCIFGIPAAGLVIKNGLAPDVVSDDVLIPAVTSATVVLLAAIKKI